jgi:AcrR family transcriptional regulator
MKNELNSLCSLTAQDEWYSVSQKRGKAAAPSRASSAGIDARSAAQSPGYSGAAVVPAISPERMQNRHDAILNAAQRAFAEKGYEGASIADIARIAKISDGLVYRYFRNKRELLYGVLQKFYERILVDLEFQVFKHDRFPARLEALIKRHIEVFIADTDLCRLFITEVRTARDYEGSAIQELNRRYTSVLIRIVKDAVKIAEVRGDVNPRLLRDVIFGAIEHLAWRHVNGNGHLRVVQITRDLTRILTSGVSSPSKVVGG